MKRKSNKKYSSLKNKRKPSVTSASRKKTNTRKPSASRGRVSSPRGRSVGGISSLTSWIVTNKLKVIIGAVAFTAIATTAITVPLVVTKKDKNNIVETPIVPETNKNTSFKTKTTYRKNWNKYQVSQYLTGTSSNQINYSKLTDYLEITNPVSNAKYTLDSITEIPNGSNDNIKLKVKISYDKKYVNGEIITGATKYEFDIDGIVAKETSIIKIGGRSWTDGLNAFKEAILVDSPNAQDMVVNHNNKIFNDYFKFYSILDDTIITIKQISYDSGSRVILITFNVQKYMLQNGTINNGSKLLPQINVDCTSYLEVRSGVIQGFNSSYTGSRENLFIPEKDIYGVNVTGIAPSAFKNQTKIKTIKFDSASKLNEIGSEAFAGCTGLSMETLEINDNVEDFGISIFSGLTGKNIKKVIVPSCWDDKPDGWRKGFTGDYKVKNRLSKLEYWKLNTSFEKDALVNYLTDDKGLNKPINRRKLGEFIDTNGSVLPTDDNFEIIISEANWINNDVGIKLKLVPNIYFDEDGKTVDNSNKHFSLNFEINYYGQYNSMFEIGTDGIIKRFDPNWTNTDYGKEFMRTGVLTIPYSVNGIVVKGFKSASSANEYSLFRTVSQYLKEIKFHEKTEVKEISDGLFSQLEKLEKIDLSKIEKIGKWAFFRNSSLNNVVLNNKVDTISEETFYECNSLTNFTANGIKVIEKSAFSSCPITSFNFSKVEEIGDSAFTRTKLSSVDLPYCISKVGRGIFRNTTTLKNISLPAHFHTIWMDADIDWAAGLDDCNFVEREPTIIQDNTFEMQLEGQVIVKVKVKVTGQLVIPDKIQGYSVKRIDGYNAFEQQNKITGIVLNATEITNIDQRTFLSSNFEPEYMSLPYVSTIERSTFFRFTSLKKIDIPNVTKLGEQAFQETWNLSEVNWSDEITEIPENCFFESGIKTLNIPNVKYIRNGAFSGSSIKNLNMIKVEEIGDEAFSNYYELENIFIPDSIRVMGNDIFKKGDDINHIFIKNISVPSHFDPNKTTGWWNGVDKSIITVRK
ncbi:MAG: leucine-rich repeat protein [Mycoplasma sp.]